MLWWGRRWRPGQVENWHVSIFCVHVFILAVVWGCVFTFCQFHTLFGACKRRTEMKRKRKKTESLPIQWQNKSWLENHSVWHTKLNGVFVVILNGIMSSIEYVFHSSASLMHPSSPLFLSFSLPFNRNAIVESVQFLRRLCNRVFQFQFHENSILCPLQHFQFIHNTYKCHVSY